MKYYIYDFDGTIYDGDSSVDFFKFCLSKNKKIIKLIPKIIIKYLSYKAKYISITDFKEYVFSFLKYFQDAEDLVYEFWSINERKIKKFYLDKEHSKDIIISASPEFLLKPICQKLKVKDLIASDVDIKNGKFTGKNNRGEIKVKNLYAKYPKIVIEEMYSDSMHDKPLFLLANHSYIVKKNKIYDYDTYKPNFIKRFWNWGWGVYHKNEELWNYLIVGALTTLVSILTYALFAKGFKFNYVLSNIFSWIITVIFAYFTNKWFVFHSRVKSILKEFISFAGSRILTLIVDTGCMALFIELIHMNDLAAKFLDQFIILVMNYGISKFLVFRKK